MPKHQTVLSHQQVHRWIQSYMMTSSNGNIFRVTGPLCGEFTGPGEFPTQRPVTWSFDVFLDLRLNKGLNKQPWGWWFETPSWSLWRQCNETCFRQFLGCHWFRIRIRWSYHIIPKVWQDLTKCRGTKSVNEGHWKIRKSMCMYVRVRADVQFVAVHGFINFISIYFTVQTW